MGLLLITGFTMLEAIRRRLFLAVVILSILIVGAFSILLSIVINASQGGNTNGNDTQLYLLGGGVIITVLAIWMVYLLSSTLTIVFTANMISGEVDAGPYNLILPQQPSPATIGCWSMLRYMPFLFLYQSNKFF